MTVQIGKTKPKAPTSGWQYVRPWDLPGEIGHVWRNATLLVISSQGDMEYRGVVVPHFHVSVSVPSSERRPNDEELATVRRDFDMQDAEEDNHSNGRIRNLFRPEHLPKGVEGVCDCKETEETVIESDGFKWQKEKA